MASYNAWQAGRSSQRRGSTRIASMDDVLSMPFDQLREEIGGGTALLTSRDSFSISPLTGAHNSFLRRSAFPEVNPLAQPGVTSGSASNAQSGSRRSSLDAPHQDMDQMEHMMQTLMAISAQPRTPEMSYEQMLRLDSSNVKRGVKPSAIRRLEKRTTTREETKRKCQICQAPLDPRAAACSSSPAGTPSATTAFHNGWHLITVALCADGSSRNVTLSW
eukprot:CAMPEP_0117649776 /NCGR_PEP_ID=MMETSP0804-20121206/1173_1 /TAXON_ID=1074897 /ORGANISM="Tetraselmis astigmatica, Strain CCMP880" /LENGTH=218 /DNA_ID=CAMNT_0005455577 /DNA_START=96 /DNA_END=753 /DNA_ORIENTATION=-